MVRLVETRKIQRLGTSSLIVTLPKEWARRVGVRPGSLVQVVSEGRILKIIPVSEDGGRESVVVEGLSEPELVGVAVNCLYLIGFDDVVIKAEGVDPSLLAEVRKRASSLLGTEVLEDEGKLRVSVLLDDSRVDPSSMVKAIGVVAGNMARVACAALEGSIDAARAESDIEQLRRDMVSYQHTVIRYMMKALAGSHSVETAYMALSVNVLSLINDRIAAVAQEAIRLRGKLSQEFKRALKETLCQVERLAPALSAGIVKPGPKRLQEIREAHNALLESARRLLDTAKGKEETIIATRLLDVAEQMRIPVYGVACNLVYKSVSKEANSNGGK